jgi:hypothetical protein
MLLENVDDKTEMKRDEDILKVELAGEVLNGDEEEVSERTEETEKDE